ncbi:uncharacterized protein LOC100202129 isoform X2 [Hydra vulgaris]|uniref:uncharacterized protein LOC100202129 isoform X2 n=1 Tax=Hydra vulgaris TaxID=6087 RepID=UPI001F5FADBC|nr:uncharacterized protein LOC100202129 isoform X2 [Hydra vulgaris]
MIFWITFLLTSSIASVEGANAHVTCQRSFSKIGCFKEINSRPDLALRPMTLEISDRDSTNPKYQGYLIDWGNMEASVHSLACRCATAARNMKMNYFSLRFWGECWVGKTDIGKLAATLKDPKWLSTDCVNSWSYIGVCDHKHEKECVAKAGSGYIYFLDDVSKSEEKIDGGYSEWSSFTECSTSCGPGVMKRERTCTNPVPFGSGEDCSSLGPMIEEKPCSLRQCPGKPSSLVVRACEWNDLLIDCSGKGVIEIVSANYGRTMSSICPGVNDLNLKCDNKQKSLDIVQSSCSNKSSCIVKASNTVFGDPCIGTYKYLEVEYNCKSQVARACE